MSLIPSRMVWGQLGYPCPVHLIMADLELLSHSSGENRRQNLSSNLSPLALSMVQQVSTPPLFADDVGPRVQNPCSEPGSQQADYCSLCHRQSHSRIGRIPDLRPFGLGSVQQPTSHLTLGTLVGEDQSLLCFIFLLLFQLQSKHSFPAEKNNSSIQSWK